MNEEFDAKRAFIASVLLSGMLANRVYDAPRRDAMHLFCEDAINFADCLIKKLEETK